MSKDGARSDEIDQREGAKRELNRAKGILRAEKELED